MDLPRLSLTDMYFIEYQTLSLVGYSHHLLELKITVPVFATCMFTPNPIAIIKTQMQSLALFVPVIHPRIQSRNWSRGNENSRDGS